MTKAGVSNCSTDAGGFLNNFAFKLLIAFKLIR